MGGLTEVERSPEKPVLPEAPEHLKAKGREFWDSVCDQANWVWVGVDDTLICLTAEPLDERQELRELMEQEPDDTRLREALRQLDKQLVTNLSLIGFTPSDRSRLGLVEARAKTKLDELMERRASREKSGGIVP